MKKTQITRMGALALGIIIASSAFGAPNYEKRFERWDANGDGSLSVEEMETVMVEMAGKQGERKGWSEEETAKRQDAAKARAPKRLEEADKDGDGELSLDEFVGMVSKKN